MKKLFTLIAIMAFAGAALAAGHNDTCEDAAWLIDQGFDAFSVDLCGFADDYQGCDGMAMGGDAVWQAVIEANTPFSMMASADDPNLDFVIYVVTDCTDPIASCVTSSTAVNGGQMIDFVTEVGEKYYFIVDAIDGCGTVRVELGGVLPTETKSWSDVKALY